MPSPSMPNDPYRLLGAYHTPSFRIGDRVQCLVRGDLILFPFH